MKLKNTQPHKKSQTNYLNYMLDARLSKIRQKTTIKLIEKENESKLCEDHLHFRTDYSDYCQNCQQQQLIINKLQIQIQESQKQIDILQIEKEIIQKKEEQTIKLLLQEIEKAKLDQKRCSMELKQSLIQFANENIIKQNQTYLNKSDQISTLNTQITQIKEQNTNYAELLHQQYDFSININIKFVQISNSLNTLINLVQKYTKIITHIQMQSSPQLDLLLPNYTEDQVKQDQQQQLYFNDLHDMTSKIQQIQIGSLTDVQQKIDSLIQLVSNYFTQAQRIAINDMSRTII